MHKLDKTVIWVRLEAALAEDQKGELVVRVVMSDITGRKFAAEELRVHHERLDLAVIATGLGLYDWNPKTGTAQYSGIWAKMLGYEASELPPHFSTWSERVHPDDLTVASMAWRDDFQDNATHVCEYRMLHRDGSWRWFLDQGRIVTRGAYGEVIRFVGATLDITERKKREDRLRYNSLHDVLTNLPNRVLLLSLLENCMKPAGLSGLPVFALLFVDLDSLKAVNDNLGHACGDQLLVEVARRLENCKRAGDTVARWGGDEFVLLLEEVEDPRQITEVVERIMQAMLGSIRLGESEAYTSASIGIVPDCRAYGRAEDMLRDADIAMLRAKNSGGACWAVFDQEMRATSMGIFQLEHELRLAVKKEEFVVFYQPVLELTSGRLAGFEALVRWQHPRRGLLEPSEFLAAAARIGVGAAIDRFVLRSACLQTREWLNELGPLPGMAVSSNLMGMSLMQPGFVEYLQATMRETGLNANHLRLELTETDLLENATDLQEVLNRLTELNVELCLDDFGTGYSSLSYLERFPVSHLKIDRSFIAKACDSEKHLAIVRTIVALAQNLGMRVTAEGVETDRQMEMVRGLKCEFAQGYRISVPLDGLAAGEWLRGRCA